MDTPQAPAAGFAPTRWSVVLAAGGTTSVQAQDALATLCQTYWYPLYAYVRRQGHAPHDAEDLTQEFFRRLLQKHYLAGIRREGGRFRSFLLTALKRFLANEWDRSRAQKRGGGQTVVSLDCAGAESRLNLEAALELAPERVYERQWAQTLLEQVLTRLHAEYNAAGRGALFDAIGGSLSQPRGVVPYSDIAVRLNTTEAAVKMAVRRLRARYRELLRLTIAQTVSDPDEIEEEIRHLFTSFGG
jgi:RNA polymerase sigma-70 factor (ECF subfamily)